MASAQVLLLESERFNVLSFAPALEKRGYAVSAEHSLPAALKRAQSRRPDIVVLNAASLRTSGTRICRQLHDALNSTPILLVADKRDATYSECGAAATLALPCTPRKLLNSVARLLPGDEGAYLRVGPIKLDVAQRRIICGSRQERVTPKQAKLLELFLRTPGQLITRKTIIKHIWDTDYMGDTRTLDVHISWLRRVIEPDSRRPRYLKTLRGQGYRLEVAGD